MSFEFLKQFVVKSDKGRGLKHTFYTVTDEQLKELEAEIDIPTELKKFYLEIGYGFMFDDNDSYSIDRLLNPDDYVRINLRKDYYEYDPTLDLFKEPTFNGKSIFFEVNEGVYLLISEVSVNGKNDIYFFDKKIADSLEEFLIRFDSEGHYFE